MKCPKCHYLGFETGDRCKNCGYDFSLLTAAPAVEDVDVDLTLHLNEADASTSPGWLDAVDLHPAGDEVIEEEAPSAPPPMPVAVSVAPVPVAAPASPRLSAV